MVLLINNYMAGQNDHLGKLEKEKIGEICKKISGMDYRVVHHSEVDGEYLKNHPEIKAVIAGGTNNNWDYLHFDVFEGEMELMRSCEIPFLGICAGHQILAIAHDGYAVHVPFGHMERYFRPINVEANCELTKDLPQECQFFRYHGLHVPELPEGFEKVFSSRKIPIQGMRKTGKPVFGVQFHPESFDEEHQDGYKLLQNFLALCK